MGINYNKQLDLKDFLNLDEGVSKSEDGFEFNYDLDGVNDIIPLVTNGVEKTSFQDIDFLYYAYGFSSTVDRNIRTEFIHNLKFSTDDDFVKERNCFVRTAINRLGNAINLGMYDVLVYPETSSPLLGEMVRVIYNWQRPKYGIVTFQLLKELPSRIMFDYDSFKISWLDTIVNNRPRYTEKQKAETLSKIQSTMDDIHNLDYFSIARDVNKTKYRHFIENYLKFENERDKKIFDGLNNAKILIVDDIVTSGSTLEQILKTIATVRDPHKNNTITLFSLLGKNDID